MKNIVDMFGREIKYKNIILYYEDRESEVVIGVICDITQDFIITKYVGLTFDSVSLDYTDCIRDGRIWINEGAQGLYLLSDNLLFFIDNSKARKALEISLSIPDKGE
jgi:hypothetical protein